MKTVVDVSLKNRPRKIFKSFHCKYCFQKFMRFVTIKDVEINCPYCHGKLNVWMKE